VRAGEVVPVEQVKFSQNFQMLAYAGPRAEKRVLHRERISGVESSFGWRVARIDKTKYRHSSSILYLCAKGKLVEPTQDGGENSLHLLDALIVQK
jgi:hypothetical protein